MQSGEVVNVYEIGRRGRTTTAVDPHKFAPPPARSLWRRFAHFCKAALEVVRESRELEAKLLIGRYRRLCDS
jgi:hypothetical protein